MAFTTIPVMYRDISNSRCFGAVLLQGTIAVEQIAELRSALRDGAYYAPLQVGLSHCGQSECSTFPTADDHGWHEMLLDEIEMHPSPPPPIGSVAPPDRGGSVEEFVATIRAAANAGWNPMIPA